MTEEMTTTGEELIGAFNPQNKEEVEIVKAEAVALVNTINHYVPPGRRRSIALTHIEIAVLMARMALDEEAS
jgi:hypothetical protein